MILKIFFEGIAKVLNSIKLRCLKKEMRKNQTLSLKILVNCLRSRITMKKKFYFIQNLEHLTSMVWAMMLQINKNLRNQLLKSEKMQSQFESPTLRMKLNKMKALFKLSWSFQTLWTMKVYLKFKLCLVQQKLWENKFMNILNDLTTWTWGELTLISLLIIIRLRILKRKTDFHVNFKVNMENLSLIKILFEISHKSFSRSALTLKTNLMRFKNWERLL